MSSFEEIQIIKYYLYNDDQRCTGYNKQKSQAVKTATLDVKDTK